MEESERIFKTIYQRALRDAFVIGLFLSGSRGKGFESPYSDYDIRIVFAEDIELDRAASPYTALEQSQVIELCYTTLEKFRAYAEFGSKDAWDRYSFAHVKALIDKTGTLQPLIDAKGKLPEEKRLSYLHGGLDTFVNSVYRSLKCHRVDNVLGAKLEAVTGVPYLLNVVFGLEGRHAPYLGYLERELKAYPLESFPLKADALLELVSEIADSGSISAQQQLMRTIEPLCKNEGMADVFDAWEEDYPWLLAYEK